MLVKSKICNVLYLYPYSNGHKGAEEQDLAAGLKYLVENKNIRVFPVSVDLSNKKLLFNFDIIFTPLKIKFKTIISYWWHYITSPDFTLRQSLTLNNFNQIRELCKVLQIDILYTNTTSTFIYGIQKNRKHFHRSICFEPIYTLRTVKNPIKKIIHFFLKIFTVWKELQCDVIFAISPRDNKYYRISSSFFLSKSSIKVLPLRQFYYLKKFSPNRFAKKFINIGFMGSTYNVLHNERSLKYLLSIMSEEFLGSNNFIFNIYGKKIPVSITSKYSSKNIVFHAWVENIDSVYEKVQIFIVPNFLNSGMQSKVFEPLVAGRVLLCDPKVLSNYDFQSYKHYLPSRNSIEFKKNLIWVKENKFAAEILSRQAGERASELIGSEKISNTIDKTLLTK